MNTQDGKRFHNFESMEDEAAEQPVPSQDEVNEYVDALRDSGVTRMFGAVMLAEWLRTYGKRHPGG